MKKTTYFVLGIFGLISLSAYILVRFFFLLLPGIGTVDKLMAILLILAELHLALHSLGFMIYVLRKSAGVVKKRRSAHIDFDNPPQVAVIVVARHEPKHVLEETFTAINSLDYKNKNLYLLDDSSLKSYKDEANKISKKYGARIFRRTSHWRR
jgi:cellulose synthase (UDP-forming)